MRILTTDCPKCGKHDATTKEGYSIDPINVNCLGCGGEFVSLLTTEGQISITDTEYKFVFFERHKLGIEGALDFILKAREQAKREEAEKEDRLEARRIAKGLERVLSFMFKRGGLANVAS
jgi:hypothetical protein